jgi:drug/metabolite transporter (DMT)-like permease
LILTLEPILNPIWVFLVIGEKPGPAAFVGALVVLAAIVGRSVLAARASPQVTR